MRYLLLLLGTITFLPIFAQHNVPEKDHFWRKRITQRLDLTLPVNAHLRTVYPYAGVDFEETEGLVPALLNGLRKNKYKAYHPQKEESMDYDAVYNRMKALEVAWTQGQVNLEEVYKKQDADAGITEWSAVEVPLEEENILSAAVLTAQPDENSFLANVYKTADKKDRFFPHLKNIDFEPYLVEVQYVEDWIFDKMSSKMIYDIEYIKVIRYNTRDKSKSDVLALFKYDEVMEHLQKTLSKPSLESVQTFSMREVFESRAFKFYVQNVSGKTFHTVDEAENKLQDLIEFESYLWTTE